MMPKLLSRLSIAAAVVVVGLVASSCKSSTEPGGGGCGSNTTPSQSMSGQLDGKSWTSNTTTVTITGGVLVITGADNCNPDNILSFGMFPSGPGTYTISNSDTSGINAVLGIGTAQYAANIFAGGSGSATFTTLSGTTAVGSFNFTVVPSTGAPAGATNHTINGTFNVK